MDGRGGFDATEKITAGSGLTPARLFSAAAQNVFVNKVQAILPLFVLLVVTGCRTVSIGSHANYSHFTALTDFSNFNRTQTVSGETVLLSPEIKSPGKWNQLVLAWNAKPIPGTFLRVEARAIQPGHTTKFFSWGQWSPDDRTFSRYSVTNQKNADGDVRADTLALNQLAEAAQIRLTLGGTNGALAELKFLGLSFCNTQIKPEPLPPNRAAWGKEISVIERSQQSYPGGSGWCSPTSLSMALARWGSISKRADWHLDAPEVAAGVADHGFKFLTGNWSFNTAFAGSRDGMRAYVTRFSDISELEDWIAEGIPVIISARYDLLQDGRADDFSGHLTVCRGFTKNGDLIINDPWTDLKVESVRHIYKRENVHRAWATSHNTVYLVYPENTKIPADRFGHWTTK
jgi:hypothetical protein